MNLGRSRHPHEASFDLTPMIDVVLLLIIFFTMTSQFARTEQKMLDLPKQAGDPTRAVLPAALFIDVDKQGDLSLLGVTKSLPEMTKLASEEALRLGEGLDVVVRADKECPARALNSLAESLAGAGIRHWKLATAVDGVRSAKGAAP
jgi:biopolymer transport protein ExbD